LFGIDGETAQTAYQGDFGNGTKNGSTVKVAEYGSTFFHKTVLTLTATPVTVTDDPGVAQYGGTGKLYTFPQALLVTYAARVTGVLTMGATGTFIDTYTGVTALGTATAGTGATLTATEADILQSTAITQAVAKVATTNAVSIATALTESGGRVFDGRSSAKELYLNFAIADDATHTSGTGTWTGTVQLLWSTL
jgi:hypothetical protein